MMGRLSATVLTCVLCVSYVSAMKQYCQPGQSCWPTASHVKSLTDSLDPTAHRQLVWDGGPRVCSVPLYSPGDQPLYGAGESSLNALYQRPDNQTQTPQSTAGSQPANTPYYGWSPAFVVFPLTADHVVSAVKFATAHNLCIAVGGASHDFLNRHSCDNGIFIRTILMKSHSFDLDDSRGLGAPDGSVTFGPGIVFSEAHNITSAVGRHVVSGWGITVGVVGWSLGGGHGPFSRSGGMGVDNILAVDIVVANGTLVTASATSNTDLFWALRGGGGSTWGVITSLTVAMHVTPEAGITKLEAFAAGDMCGPGLEQFHTYIDEYFVWSQQLSPKWSGLAFFAPNGTAVANCSATWYVFLQYVYLGPDTDEEYLNATAQLRSAGLETGTFLYASVWDYAADYVLEYIDPSSYMAPTPSYVGGVPSVVVNASQTNNGALAAQIKENVALCPDFKHCRRQEMYHDLHPLASDPTVSIPPGFRSGQYHVVAGFQSQELMEPYYTLGENSYQNEAAYSFPGADTWKYRLFGANYPRLLSIKKAVDPTNVFWCHHCVGSDLP